MGQYHTPLSVLVSLSGIILYASMGTFLVTFYLTCRFVHMDSESASQEAIRNLNGKHDFHGRKMKVRPHFAIALNW